MWWFDEVGLWVNKNIKEREKENEIIYLFVKRRGRRKSTILEGEEDKKENDEKENKDNVNLRREKRKKKDRLEF